MNYNNIMKGQRLYNLFEKPEEEFKDFLFRNHSETQDKVFEGINFGEDNQYFFKHNLKDVFIDPLFSSDIPSPKEYESAMKELYELI